TLLLNAGAAHIHGLEATLNWRASEAWRFAAGLNLLGTKYTDLVLGADRLTGNELISAPKVKLNAAIDYRGRPTETHVLDLSLGGSFQARQWYSAYNDKPGYEHIGQGAYGLLNARAALSDNGGRYTLAASISNLLDRQYDSYAINLAGFG